MNGFLLEMDKLAAVSSKRFKNAKANPYTKDIIPFKKLAPWQKARVVGGIGANVAFGIAPLAMGAAALLKKKPDYQSMYEESQRRIGARERAMEIAGQ